jgi:hypothetical protein
MIDAISNSASSAQNTPAKAARTPPAASAAAGTTSVSDVQFISPRMRTDSSVGKIIMEYRSGSSDVVQIPSKAALAYLRLQNKIAQETDTNKSDSAQLTSTQATSAGGQTTAETSGTVPQTTSPTPDTSASAAPVSTPTTGGQDGGSARVSVSV